MCTIYFQLFLPQSTDYLWQRWAAGRFSLPRENQARIDEVKQPASTQASPPRRPAGACWDLYHVEDKMKLSWVSKTRATEMAPQMVRDGKRQRQGETSACESVCARHTDSDKQGGSENRVKHREAQGEQKIGKDYFRPITSAWPLLTATYFEQFQLFSDISGTTSGKMTHF